MKTFIKNHAIRAICFDVDGTFYPAEFYLKTYYEFLIDSLKVYYDYTREQSIKALTDYGIYNYYDPVNSRSGTDFMINTGIPADEWNAYRDIHYRLRGFKQTTTVDVELLKDLKKDYLLFVVSNNTPDVIEETLGEMEVDLDIFDYIYTSIDLFVDDHKVTKDHVYKRIHDTYDIAYEEMIGVGDRYIIDLDPLVQLGGNGLLVEGPEELIALKELIVPKEKRA
ncbi:MAG: HAD family hydrolase [Erysipelotrichaceae bacterium]|nr:HAD family hydrolase [Erysipelotrichaceae bacterium]